MLKINTSNLVWSVLESDPAIKKALSKGLVNTTALAKYIIRVADSDASMDAVVMSIKRNLQDKKTPDYFSNVNSVLKDIKFRLKTKIGVLVLKKEPTVFSLLQDVLSCIDYCGAETFRLVNGIDTIELVVDDKNLDKMLNIYSKDKIIKMRNGLGEISMSMPSEVEHTVGVFSTILSELSIHDINVFKTITTHNEFLIYVEENDLSKSYNLLYKLHKESTTSNKKDNNSHKNNSDV